MGKKGKDNVDWVNLIKLCRDDSDNVSELFQVLKPSLLKMANTIASQIVDDAVQVAIIKIWKKLDHIDLSRPDSIKSYLLTMATRAMRDEVSLYLRRSLKQVNLGVDDSGKDRLELLPDNRPPPILSSDRLSGILGEYVKYIEENYTIRGAHTKIAKKLNLNLADVVGTFNEQIAHLDGYRRYKSLIDKIIEGK